MPLPVDLRMRGQGQKLGPVPVVTTLRPLFIDVEAQAAFKQIIRFLSVPIQAELVYEDGTKVKGLNDQPPLVDTDRVCLIAGAATFRLRISSEAKVTSEQHNKKKFRIRISVVDGHLYAYTRAFKIMTRVNRPSAKQRDAVAGLLQIKSTPEEEVQRLVDEHAAQLKALMEDHASILDELRSLRELVYS
jgi:hypothetical protein